MTKNVHIVPHMHWDREWYFTTEESRILLVNNMEEIMEMLETNPDYPHYVLDGQTAILEDYFAVKPENRERVRKLVQAGKLIIGPWYTQTDEMVVGAESIVRNLLYGLKDCEEFGEPMMIGYLPDSFGQSAQLPQILNGFDIKRAMFWRGTSERHGTNKTEFNWTSEDGSSVVTQLLPLGYAIGKYLPTEFEALKKRCSKYMPVLDRGATSEHILVPNGHDQMPIQKNIFEVMGQLKNIYPERDFFLSRFEHVFNEIEKNELPTISGEFLDGKYMRVHRSIYSTRMDIKAANARIENKITNILEPLATIAYSFGFEYHHGLIELIWKDIMKNHAHDSIGACCSDKVHREIMSRFWLAEDKTDELIGFYKRVITDAMSQEKTLDKLVAFNLLAQDRDVTVEGEIITKMKNFKLVDGENNEIAFEVVATEVVDAGLIDRQIVHYGDYDPFVKYTVQLTDTVPAMGFKAYMIAEIEGDVLVNTPEAVQKVSTDFYDITVNANGSLNITDKQTSTTYENVLVLENGADDGDEYDFSPLADDFIITSENAAATVELKQSARRSYINISYTMDVPKDLDSRKAKVCDTTLGIKMTIEVDHNRPFINVDMSINNTAGDHRLRAYVPTNIASAFSLSDNQFGAISRPVVDEAMAVWEKEGWDERPDSIYPFLTYVTLSNESRGMAVLSNSTREFEIVGESFDTIALTLFRSVGFLGKEEMLRRPGRPSGIKLPTPDSQMYGEVKVDFALCGYANDALTANVAKLAKEYLTPIVTYNKMPHNAMKLNAVDFETPYTYSLLKEVNDELTLSVIKKAEKADGIIVRFFNATNEVKAANIQANVKTAQFVKLNEIAQGDVTLNNIECGVNTVKSVFLELV